LKIGISQVREVKIAYNFFPSSTELVLLGGAFQSLGYSSLKPGEFFQNHLFLPNNCVFVGKSHCIYLFFLTPYSYQELSLFFTDSPFNSVQNCAIFLMLSIGFIVSHIAYNRACYQIDTI